MRKLAVALLFGLIVSMFMMAYADETQNEIASGVVRLHIVANSDEAGDQTVKLMVRDEIIREFSAVLSQAQSRRTQSTSCRRILAGRQRLQTVY